MGIRNTVHEFICEFWNKQVYLDSGAYREYNFVWGVGKQIFKHSRPWLEFNETKVLYMFIGDRTFWLRKIK